MSNPYDPQQPADDPRPPQPPSWSPQPEQDAPASPPPAAGYGAPPEGYGASQQAYGAPQGGYGAPPAGYGPSGPAGPAQPGTNGLAVAALVSGVLGFFCLTAIAAIVLGIVALGQIRRTGRKGRGLAIAGIVLGALWIVVSLFSIPATINAISDATESASATSTSSTDPAATTAPTEEESSTEPQLSTAVLSLGDCIDDPAVLDGVDVPQSAVVDCSTPHYAEAYAEFDLPEGDFPGDQAASDAAQQGCDAQFTSFVGVPYEESVFEVYFYYPTEAAWLFDRGVVCVLYDPAGDPVTGSLQGANR